MINSNKILKAIREVIEKYPQEVSDEHIVALLELYADSKLKKFKLTVVNELKDLLEEEELSREKLNLILERILTA
jgi:hypothetical protein